MQIYLYVSWNKSAHFAGQLDEWVMRQHLNWDGQGQNQFIAIGPFFMRYSRFNIWPWKFKVKVMAKVKIDGHISDLASTWYGFFSFMEVGPFCLR